MNFIADVLAARERIRPYARVTPLEHARTLSRITGGEAHLKLENLQHTGSFKFRGALNFLLLMSEPDRARGVLTASTGNHGAAVARACEALHAPCIVYVPRGASPGKLDNIRLYGAEIREYGVDSVETELHALDQARREGRPYVPPYNDDRIIAGQGTVGAEILEQLPELDVVFVTVGGGGLVSGVAGYLKSARPAVRVIGCQPRNSAVMFASVEAGRIVEMESAPTLSDGSAGGIEPGAITLGYVGKYVDEFELLSEAEIADAMRWCLSVHHFAIEGAAGVALAACMRRAPSLRGLRVGVVICGGNVGVEKAVCCWPLAPSDQPRQ